MLAFIRWMSAFNRLIHGTVNAALCLNSSKCWLTTTISWGEESCSRCTAGFPRRNIWEKLSGKSMHALTPIVNASCFHGVFSGRKSYRIIARVSYASFLKSCSLNALLSTMKHDGSSDCYGSICSEIINTYYFFFLLKKAKKILCICAKFDSCWLGKN